MNDLEKYFRSNEKRLIHKWINYFDVYERHFSKYRNKDVVILEIGVYEGGSLQMWKDYFGDKAKIFAIDLDPRCKQLEEENIVIFTGSQSDRKFLRNLRNEIPMIDIMIDDGGHMMTQQIVSFDELFDHIKEDGIYLCEDTHTSYILHYGGGHRRRGTFIEYSKNFIDYLNAHHSKQRSLKVNEFTKSVNSIHYYDSIVVIEKKIMSMNYHEQIGKRSLETYPIDKNIYVFKKIFRKIKMITHRITYLLLFIVNKPLQSLRLGGIVWK